MINLVRQELPPEVIFKKQTLAQVFSCEFCEMFKNTFFTEHFRVTASGAYAKMSEKQTYLPFDTVKFAQVLNG